MSKRTQLPKKIWKSEKNGNIYLYFADISPILKFLFWRLGAGVEESKFRRILHLFKCKIITPNLSPQIHTCIHTYIHTYIHMYVCTDVRTYEQYENDMIWNNWYFQKQFFKKKIEKIWLKNLKSYKRLFITIFTKKALQKWYQSSCGKKNKNNWIFHSWF